MRGPGSGAFATSRRFAAKCVGAVEAARAPDASTDIRPAANETRTEPSVSVR